MKVSNFHGFSKAFFDTPTITSFSEWLRKYAKRGLYAALVAAAFVAVVLFAAESVVNLAIVTVAVVVGVAVFSVAFTLYIGRDVDFSGELLDE